MCCYTDREFVKNQFIELFYFESEKQYLLPKKMKHKNIFVIDCSNVLIKNNMLNQNHRTGKINIFPLLY